MGNEHSDCGGEPYRVSTVLSTRTNQMWRAEDPQMRLRPEQRMADALAELLYNTSDDQNPGLGGTSLLLIAHYNTLSQQIENARLGDGTPIPVKTFETLACDARILPAIFDAKGQPLWGGRAKRLATPTQRISLIARDRGCVGCGADPAGCQSHHIIAWSAGGKTNINNLGPAVQPMPPPRTRPKLANTTNPPRKPHPPTTTHQHPTPRPPSSPPTHHQTAAFVKTPHKTRETNPAHQG